MDEVYRAIYKEMFRRSVVISPDYPFFPPFSRRNYVVNQRFLEKIKDIIESQEREHLHLRPDARYFLLLNLYCMIGLPIYLRRIEMYDADHETGVNSQSPDITNSELLEAIEKDVSTLLKTAAEISSSQDSSEPIEISDTKEISGHAVLQAVDRNWSKLRVNKYAVWAKR